MTEPITPIDKTVELRTQVVDVMRSALRPDARTLESDSSIGSTEAAGLTPGAGRKAGDEAEPVPEQKAEPAQDLARNLALRFRIDPDTHAVTVLLVDQTTKKIVRSVPPEDLQKLNSGDLVHLLA